MGVKKGIIREFYYMYYEEGGGLLEAPACSFDDFPYTVMEVNPSVGATIVEVAPLIRHRIDDSRDDTHNAAWCLMRYLQIDENESYYTKLKFRHSKLLTHFI